MQKNTPYGVQLIPAAGVEPARPCGHWILSPARLPVPPLRQKITHDWIHPVKGGNRIRTDDKGFADLCLTTWLYHHNRLSNLIGPAK